MAIEVTDRCSVSGAEVQGPGTIDVAPVVIRGSSFQ